MIGQPQIHYPNIPTAVTSTEADALAVYASGKLVLGIGSQYGFSDIVLAQVARHVVAVDHHRGDHDAGFTDTLERYLDNVKFHAMMDRISPILADWRTILPLLNVRSFGLIFFDAEHDTKSVSQFLCYVLPRCHLSVIAVHDYGRFGVREAVDSLCGAPWRLEVVDHLAVLMCG